MQGDVEDVAVIVEHVLDPVAMMDIPVYHKHPVQPVLADRVLGGDPHIVEETEAVWLVRLGVVAGRADHGQPRPAAHQHVVYTVQHSARRQ